MSEGSSEQPGGDVTRRRRVAGAVPTGLADATAERIKQLGGQILNGPMDVPGNDRVAQAMDPQGAAFGIHSSAKK